MISSALPTSVISLFDRICGGMMSVNTSLLIFLSLCAVFFVSHCDNSSWSWSDCSKKDDIMKILDVNLPAASQSINVTYKLEKGVTNGTIFIKVKYGVVPSYSTTISLCDPLKCPVTTGKGSFVLKNPVEPYAQPGTYTLEAVVKDQNNTELACFMVIIKKSRI